MTCPTSEPTAIVSRILPFSCVDGPGNRLVIFLQGCNMRCLNCHNPHTINHCNHCGDCVDHCPTGALTFKEDKVAWQESLCTHCDACIDACNHLSNPKVAHYTLTQILDEIRTRAPFLRGITVSGGEATLQLPFIIQLFAAIKQEARLAHLTCFVDSNGTLPLGGWDKLMPHLDGAMIDLKAWQDETHQWLVGRSNHRVLDAIRYLASEDKLHEVRLLHIPGKSDLDTEIDAVSAFLNRLPQTIQIRLNAFQHHGVTGEALEWETCSEAQMLAFAAQLGAKIKQPIITPSRYL